MVASGKRIKESGRVTYSAKVLHGSLAGSAQERASSRKAVLCQKSKNEGYLDS